MSLDSAHLTGGHSMIQMMAASLVCTDCCSCMRVYFCYDICKNSKTCSTSRVRTSTIHIMSRICEKWLQSLDTTSLKKFSNLDLWFLSPHLKILALQNCLKLIIVSYYSLIFTHWHLRTIRDMHDWNRVIYKWVISFRCPTLFYNRIVCRTIVDGIHTICYRLD